MTIRLLGIRRIMKTEMSGGWLKPGRLITGRRGEGAATNAARSFKYGVKNENTEINRPVFVSFPNIFPIISNNICAGLWEASSRRRGCVSGL